MRYILALLARFLIVVAIVAIVMGVLTVSYWIKGWPFLGITCILLLALFLYQGMREIPASPPHVALYTLFGRRIAWVAEEGWGFFPLQPFLVGFIPIRGERMNQDLGPEIFKTPDLADLKIRVALTWTPDWKSPKNLIAFVTNGGEEGVRRILDDVVPERIREWITSKFEGPLAFRDAMTAQEEAVWVLLKAIVGETLHPEIPPAIPSPVLLKLLFWGENRLSSEEKEKWLPVWQGLSEKEKAEIRHAMEERRKVVSDVREGNGGVVVPHLGIRLNRLNLSEIVPQGPIVVAAEKIATEQEEAKAETVEAEFLAKRANILSKDTGIPMNDAIAALQVERGKATKEIREHRLDLSPSAADALEKIGPKIGQGLGVAAGIVAAMGVAREAPRPPRGGRKGRRGPKGPQGAPDTQSPEGGAP